MQLSVFATAAWSEVSAQAELRFCVLDLWYCPSSLWGTVCFQSFVFPSSSLDWVISTDLPSSSLVLSSTISNLLLRLVSEFVISVIVLFSSRISISYIISISLLRFPIYSFIIFPLILWTSLNWLNIFITAALKSVTTESKVWAHLESSSNGSHSPLPHCLPPSMITFPVFCMSYWLQMSKDRAWSGHFSLSESCCALLTIVGFLFW